MYASKKPLLERLNRAKENFIDRESKKFSSKERRKLFIETVNSFSNYTDQVLSEYVDQVFDMDREAKYRMAWYRACYVTLPEAGISLTPKLTRADADIVESALIEGQIRCLEDKTKKEGKIDPETPITSFYMSKDAYDFFDNFKKNCTSDVQFRHFLACYQLFCINEDYICIMPVAEIGIILRAAGYNLDDIFMEMQTKKKELELIDKSPKKL